MLTNKHLTRRRLLQIGAASAGAAALSPSNVWAKGLGTPLDPNNLTIAVGHSGPITDGGWSENHHKGIMAIKAAYPNAKILEVENVPASSKGARTIRQLAAQGADMVIMTSGYGEIIDEVAGANPDIAFLEASGYTPMPNKRSYYIKGWKADYLNGIAAGRMTKTNKLGFIASYPVPSVNFAINGLHAGARSVNPDVTTSCIFINSWFDPQAMSQAAQALVDSGADVLASVVEGPEALQVAEKNGVFAFGSTGDMSEFGPNAYIGSAIIDWDEYYVAQVRDLVEGNWTGGDDLLDLGRGVDVADFGKIVPQAVRDEVAAKRQQLIDGAPTFVGPMNDNEGNARLAAGEALPEEVILGWDWYFEGISVSS